MREGLSSEHARDWKSPERQRLVVDSRVGRAEWVRRESEDDDVVDAEQQMEVMLEAARQAATERARASEPSVDEAEQARLEELRRQLQASRQAVDAAPAWKRWAAGVFPNTDLARQNAATFRLANEVRVQEELVRDLAAVIPVDSVIRTIRDKDPNFNESLASAFRDIRRSLGAPGLFGQSDIPRTSAERAAARTQLERVAASGGKVRAKWAAAGLRLLSAYEAAYPTREDSRTRLDAARAAEFARTGPMELVNGKWARLSGNVSPAVRPPASRRPEEHVGEELFAK